MARRKANWGTKRGVIEKTPIRWKNPNVYYKVYKPEDGAIAHWLPEDIGDDVWCSAIDGKKKYLTRGRKIYACWTYDYRNELMIEKEVHARWDLDFMKSLDSKKKRSNRKRMSFHNAMKFFTCYCWYWES